MLETPGGDADLVETLGGRELRRLPDDVAQCARGLLGVLDPLGRLALPQVREARDEPVEIAAARRVCSDLAEGRDGDSSAKVRARRHDGAVDPDG